MVLSPSILLLALLAVLLLIGGIIVTILIVRALLAYSKSKPVRTEQELLKKSLGETLKAHRMERKMTQEFVAESLGVSRQAVSKWEQGKSDPSTSNLLALAKLFGIPADELLKEVK